MEVKKRDCYFDLVKAVAIFMVVFGHVTSALGCHSMIASAFIVGCNMPLFFIMSGYFAHDTIIHADCKRLMRHLSSYVQPMISIGILLSCCSAILGLISMDVKSVGMYAAKWFLFSPWFLWTLMGIYLICFLFFRVAHSFKVNSIIILSLIMILMFCPNVLKGLLHIPAIRNMLPFFLAGMIFRHYSFMPWRINWIGRGSLVLFMLFVMIEGDVSKNGMGFYWVDSSWSGVLSSVRGLITFILRPVVGVLGSIGVMWILTNFPMLKYISVLGRYTICIYLLHFWVLERLIAYVQPSWTNSLIMSIGLLIACGGFGYFTMEYSKFARRLLWGR